MVDFPMRLCFGLCYRKRRVEGVIGDERTKMKAVCLALNAASNRRVRVLIGDDCGGVLPRRPSQYSLTIFVLTIIRLLDAPKAHLNVEIL